MKLSIVIPCFNEEQALPYTFDKLTVVLQRLEKKGLVESSPLIYFVDDGSSDATWSVIQKLAGCSESVRGVKLSRNCGHQNALLAGLTVAEGDAIISIDADLQDDIDIFDEMVAKHAAGFEIVYGVRNSRVTDTPFKRKTAEFFYTLMGKLGAEVVHNHADFRLMGRRSLEKLKEFREVNLFLRGIVPLLGYTSCQVFYTRSARVAGESKYPLKKMLTFALNGITSFSVVPLRIIAVVGIAVSMLSMLMLVWIIVVKWVLGAAIPGWTSTMVPITLLGGVQLFCLGVVGEYVGKIYQEVKARPKFVVEDMILGLEPPQRGVGVVGDVCEKTQLGSS
jgi:polyisoprenyl-phosphate glycosyltransferase